MKEFVIDIQLRWADMDPNFHVRHSVYYDWAAQSRVAFLDQFNLTAEVMQQLHTGPILFREECVFKREIRTGDAVAVDITLMKAKRDYSRWTVQHVIKKNGDTVAAIITVDGAWLNTSLRKLAIPPQQAVDVFANMPKHENMEWID